MRLSIFRFARQLDFHPAKQNRRAFCSGCVQLILQLIVVAHDSRAKVGGLLNDDAHGQRQRRKANAAPPWRTAQPLREQDNVMTQIDCLFEVARKLKEARTLGEACSDRALLYFIDMTIVHVCDSLDSQTQTKAQRNLM
jgi:hypothetical protein